MTNMQTQERPAPAQRQNGAAPVASPLVDIHETKDAYIVRAEMPGVRKEGRRQARGDVRQGRQ